MTDLKELAYICQRVEEPGVEKLPEYERWLAMLIAPGTSLGGSRPKANFTDSDQRLWFAKFPAHDDRYDVGGWECVVHRLADKAGIRVPDSRLERLTERYSTSIEAVKEGYYTSPVTGASYPKVQILTISGLLNGTERALYPDLSQGSTTFKKAKIEEK